MTATLGIFRLLTGTSAHAITKMTKMKLENRAGHDQSGHDQFWVITKAGFYLKKLEIWAFVLSILLLTTCPHTHNQFLDTGDPTVVK